MIKQSVILQSPFGFFTLRANLVTSLNLKKQFHPFYVLTLLTNFSVVTALLPIIMKLNINLKSLKSECVIT